MKLWKWIKSLSNKGYPYDNSCIDVGKNIRIRYAFNKISVDYSRRNCSIQISVNHLSGILILKQLQ